MELHLNHVEQFQILKLIRVLAEYWFAETRDFDIFLSNLKRTRKPFLEIIGQLSHLWNYDRRSRDLQEQARVALLDYLQAVDESFLKPVSKIKNYHQFQRIIHSPSVRRIFIYFDVLREDPFQLFLPPKKKRVLVPLRRPLPKEAQALAVYMVLAYLTRFFEILHQRRLLYWEEIDPLRHDIHKMYLEQYADLERHLRGS